MAGKIKKEVVDYKDFGKGPTLEQSAFSDHYQTVNQKLLGESDGPFKAPERTEMYTKVGPNYSGSTNFASFNRL
jgi:hypothetical protein